MDEDNMYPTQGGQGSYFVPTEPQDQVIARKKERAKTLEMADFVTQLIKHLDERIAERDRISTIGIDILENPEIHQKRCLVNAMIAQALNEEKKILEELLEIHTRKT